MRISIARFARSRGVALHAEPSKLQEHRATLEDLLIRNILGWWYPETLDYRDGGYRLNHDVDGRYRGPGNKTIVTQARVMWFLARISRTKYGKPEHLDGARHGFAFLHNDLWDAEHGGFYWEVNSKGSRATKREKHLYGQAFGLYALSEYAIASGDEQAKDLADQLFNLLDHHAHDARYGGYRELFDRDWSSRETTANPMESEASPRTKLANTHLHLMEAMTTYYAMSRNPAARERLLELISILSVAVVRPNAAASTDKFAADWTPLPGYDRISYGHNVQSASLLIEACEISGISIGPIRGVLEMIFDTSLRYGLDEKEGGFYDAGPFGAPADRLTKISWVQAEALMAALQMYRLTGKEKYLACFRQTLDWVVKHQVDREHGDWHLFVSPEGEITGDKAGPWGGPYHHGRAMIVCLELLDRMGH